MSRVKIEMERFEDAKELLHEAQRLSEDLNEKELFYRIHMLFADLFLRKCESKEAEVQIRLASTYANELGTETREGDISLITARLRHVQGRFADVSGYFKKACDIFLSLKEQLMVGQAYFYYGKSLTIQGKQQKGRSFIGKAREIFEKLGTKGWLRKAKESQGGV